MFWCRKESNQAQCLKTLKEALLGKKQVRVETLSGLFFIDEVVSIDVLAGSEVAVLRGNGPLRIADIQTIADAVA